MRKKLIFAFVTVLSLSWALAAAFAWQNTASNTPPLSISSEALPDAALQQICRFRLQAVGGIPPLHWTVTSGQIPPGLELEDSGVISGIATKIGDYRFTVTVADSDNPPHRASKEFTISIVAPLVLEWSRVPHVQDNRIEGAVRVSNGTKDDFDLTVIVVAVNETGKAFVLGYQHPDLKGGATEIEIPFGSTLPQGAYVVHADAVAEVSARNAIYRRRLQTPAPLQVTVGP